MSADLKPYPAMKDSGVEWLGDVPKHWTTERFKSSMHNIVEQTTERRGASLYVALEHVESWTGRLRHAGLDVSFDSQVKCFRSGDVLFGKLRPYLAKVTRPTSDGICVGEFLVLRPRHSNATAPYMEQQLRSKPIIDAVNSSTFGAKMPRADWQFMGGMAIALPPLPEQAAIVRFLDHADRRIRRYIRAKQQLITLLEEQKQALIHRTVTGQVDVRTSQPYPAYKPSGVEWLGEVPAHWTIRKLGRIATVFNGATPSRAQPAYWVDGTVPWLNSSKVNEEVVVEPSELVTDRALRECSISLVRSGAVVLGLVGQGRTRGMSALLGIDAAISQNLAAIVPGTVVDGTFLNRLLTALYKHVREMGRGGNQEALNCDLVSRMRLPIPPLHEQVEIVSSIDSTLEKLGDSLEKTIEGMGFVREYRTRLIADIVTGKLDVREAVAGLPEVDPLAAEDDSDDGSNPEAPLSHSDEVGVTDQEAEA